MAQAGSPFDSLPDELLLAILRLVPEEMVLGRETIQGNPFASTFFQLSIR